MNKKYIIGALFCSLFLINSIMFKRYANSKISLSDIRIMALAGSEGWPPYGHYCDDIWSVTYTGNMESYVIDCAPGGDYVCPYCIW